MSKELNSFKRETVVENTIEKKAPTEKINPDTKKKYKIIAIMLDGCLAEDIENSAYKIRLFGAEYLVMKVGDIIEI